MKTLLIIASLVLFMACGKQETATRNVYAEISYSSVDHKWHVLNDKYGNKPSYVNEVITLSDGFEEIWPMDPKFYNIKITSTQEYKDSILSVSDIDGGITVQLIGLNDNIAVDGAKFIISGTINIEP